MPKIINKKTLEHLAELTRIEINEKEEKKLLKDIQEILSYFKKLNDLNTENIKPFDGGTENENVLNQDDAAARQSNFNKKRLLDDFPEKEGGFLKIPPVF